MTLTAQPANNTSAPVFLCADPDEAERLAVRDLHAICPPADAATPSLAAYGGARVYVTPRGRRERFGVAAVLNALGCDVHALDSTFSFDAPDPATCPTAPMFPRVPDVEPDTESELAGRPLDWRALAQREIPKREWIVDHWIGGGHVTLLAGRGGIGKSLLAQQIGSAVALGSRYVDTIPAARNVLYWAAEDDDNELWRRQAAIAAHMGVTLDAFAGKLFVQSFADRDCTLAGMAFGALTYTLMISELRAQIMDYRADLVILDPVARLFAGNENSRHDVTAFLAALVGTAPLRNPAILLLGHNSRLPGSEFSGSSAWENSVRSRLWFDDRPPDQPKAEDDEPDPDLRYLARRKANYTARDLRTLHYREGVFVADASESTGGGLVDHLRRNKADRVTLEAFRKLLGMGLAPGDGATSTNYLPKMILEYRLGEGLTRRELGDALRRLMTDGKLKRGQIGTYSNRAPRFGLTEA